MTTTVGEIIDSGERVDPRFLEKFCTTVLKILENQARKGRPHGNLSAATIEVVAWKTSRVQVRLPEPIHLTEATMASIADDVFALGVMTGQMAVRSPYFPEPDASAWDKIGHWKSLGRAANLWRGFCGALLDRGANGSPQAIGSLLGELQKIVAHRRRWDRTRRIARIAVVVSVIACAALFWKSQSSVRRGDSAGPGTFPPVAQNSRTVSSPSSTPTPSPRLENTNPASEDVFEKKRLDEERLARDNAEQEKRAKAKAEASRMERERAEQEAVAEETARRERIEFNKALDKFRGGVVAATDLDKASFWKSEFERDLKQLENYRSRKEVSALLAELSQKLLSPHLVLDSLKRAGWNEVGKGGEDWVVYSKNGVEMPFISIELQPGGERVAIAAIEMPAELALATRKLPTTPRDGVRVWANGALTKSYGWPSALEVLSYIHREFLDRKDPEPSLVAPGLRETPPPLAPLNSVSAEEARSIAGALGAEIPSNIAWAKALQLARNSGWTEAPRLRGKAWARQIKYLEDLEARALAHLASTEPNVQINSRRLDLPGGATHWPDYGSYAQGRGQAGQFEGDELWFSAVDRQSRDHPRGIYDLIGNVAEYVTVTKDQTIIVGASAISAPTANAEVGYSARSRNGYSDVGFRLAVPIPGRADDSLTDFRRLVSTFRLP